MKKIMNIRKIVLSTILLVGGLAYAQTNGKVGINIELQVIHWI